VQKKETILTRHPQGKKGVNILRRRYDLAAQALLDTLREHGEMGAMDLYEVTAARLEGRLDGKPLWYVATVKLDLEAQGLLETRKRGGVQKVFLK
jgi:hypothetical protein